jgi:hypothetical protein
MRDVAWEPSTFDLSIHYIIGTWRRELLFNLSRRFLTGDNYQEAILTVKFSTPGATFFTND